MSEGEVDWSGYESGPFCRHWGDPMDCDLDCACGHRCAQHELDEGRTNCTKCDCIGYKEATE